VSERIAEGVYREADLVSLSQYLCPLLLAEVDYFVVWMKGSLGAGKSTFCRTLLYELGLDRSQPVSSPTFTYMIEYPIGPDWFAHLDLYRLPEQGDLSDLISARRYRGYLVEWPDRANCLEILPPTHIVELNRTSDHERHITIVKI
jgi:tRNA threonylcarbamoyl adenosine modification protein YjeE